MQTTKTYQSGISGKLVAFMSVVFLAIMILPMTEGDWTGVIIIIPVAAFILHLFSNTNYSINGTTLRVKSGFVVNITVDINTIRSIAETDTILSAPAASMDRLEITYNKYDSVVISPKYKAEFIADILAVNDQIKVTYKG
jgi:hypothetical protein